MTGDADGHDRSVLRRVRIGIAAAAFAVQLYNIFVLDLAPAVLGGIFLGLALAYTFIFVDVRMRPRTAFGISPGFLLDLCLAALSVVATFYIALDFEEVFSRAGDISPVDFTIAILGIALVLEGTRRTAGSALPILAILFLLYPLWYGSSLPGLLRTGTYSFNRVLTLQYLSLEGVFGSALQVTIEYVFLFVVYGALLNRVGAIEFMDDLAKALCGRLRGGSAKIATLSSLFMGLASGSAVANVVSQGVFTIPMMRREGYKPEMAAAVEASASTGGQIMPPVMGAAAFLMAEYARIPYTQIILHALLPGLLFYFAIWCAVHWQAVKTGMKGIPREEVPPLGRVLREGGLHGLSIIVITVEMAMGRAMSEAVLHGMLTAVVAALVQPRSRALVRPGNVMGSLSDGFDASIALFTSAACAGIIIGVFTQTALGLKISTLVIDASMGMTWLALLLCAVVSLILGMGLPTQIIYLTLAALVAPAIVKLGVTVAGAHLFIIYFGMMSMVTPPVCFAAFAAAGIAGAPLMRTGWLSMRVSLAGLLAPFYFAYHPGLLLIGSWQDIVEGLLRALIGIYAAGVALGMFWFREADLRAPVWADIAGRLCCAAATGLLIAPGLPTLAAGIVLAAAAAVLPWVVPGPTVGPALR